MIYDKLVKINHLEVKINIKKWMKIPVEQDIPIKIPRGWLTEHPPRETPWFPGRTEEKQKKLYKYFHIFTQIIITVGGKYLSAFCFTVRARVTDTYREEEQARHFPSKRHRLLGTEEFRFGMFLHCSRRNDRCSGCCTAAPESSPDYYRPPEQKRKGPPLLRTSVARKKKQSRINYRSQTRLMSR